MTYTAPDATEWLVEVQTEAEATIAESLTDDEIWGEPEPHASDPDEDAEEPE